MIVTKSENGLMVTAPVLIPNTPDCDFERGEPVLNEEQVKNFAESFKNYGVIEKNHDFLHTLESVGEPVDSYVTSEEMTITHQDGEQQTVPPGTWMLSLNVTNPTSIQKIKSGEYTGLSVTTLPRKSADQIKNVMSTKSTSAHDRICDIQDPVAFAVSLVRKPCVGGAKFCKNKKENMKMSTESKLDKIRALVNNTDEEYATKADIDDLRTEIKTAVKTGIREGVQLAVKESLSKPKKRKSPRNGNGDGTEEEGSKTNPEEENKDTSNSRNSTRASDEEEETSDYPEDEEEVEFEDDETQDEDEEENTKRKRKNNSKSAKVHNKRKIAQKSTMQTVYEAMGRDGTGSRIRN